MYNIEDKPYTLMMSTNQTIRIIANTFSKDLKHQWYSPKNSPKFPNKNTPHLFHRRLHSHPLKTLVSHGVFSKALSRQMEALQQPLLWILLPQVTIELNECQWTTVEQLRSYITRVFIANRKNIFRLVKLEETLNSYVSYALIIIWVE